MTELTQGQIREKLTQVFQYIQAFNLLQNPVERDVRAQPWVLWLQNLPKHPCLRRGTLLDEEHDTSHSIQSESEPPEISVGNTDFILKVRRPQLTEAPAAPQEIVPWLQDGWQNVDGKVIVKPILQTGLVGQMQVRFNADPARQQLLEEWKVQRERWVRDEKPAREAIHCFDQLYTLHARLGREPEHLELMLGDGLLNWQMKDDRPIYHPVLLLRLQLHFDPQIPEFTLTETGQPPELYTALFQTIPQVRAVNIGRAKKDFAKDHWHPLADKETSEFLKRLVNLLSRDGEFGDSGSPQQNKFAPRIVRNPVFFLRSRTLGFNAAIDTILDELPTSTNIPYFLQNLVSTKDNRATRLPANHINDTTTGALNDEDERILLSKPANMEQMDIARQLETFDAVLVQGPPGTGKTHTIANLLGHLLAEGKNILVTSHTPKALRVLREKVVEPLQPLCVSILEDDSRKQMESTIDAINKQLSSTNEEHLASEIDRLTRERGALIQKLRETRENLKQASSEEYRPIKLAEQEYAPSEAARYVFAHKKTLNRIPSPVSPGSGLPLTMSEFGDLYRSNTALTIKDEREIDQHLPLPSTLLSPTEFATLVQAQKAIPREKMNYRVEIWQNTSVSQPIEKLLELQNRLAREIVLLEQSIPILWCLATLTAGREGGNHLQMWKDLVDKIKSVDTLEREITPLLVENPLTIPQGCLPERAEEVLEELINWSKYTNQVDNVSLFNQKEWKQISRSLKGFPSNSDIILDKIRTLTDREVKHTEEVIHEILAHLDQGGTLNTWQRIKKPDWRRLITTVKIKGRPLETKEHFQALQAFLRLEKAREDLMYRWRQQMAPLCGLGETISKLEPEKTCMQFIPKILQCLEWFPTTWKPFEQELETNGLIWSNLEREMSARIERYGEILRLHDAVVKELPRVIDAEVNRRTYALHEQKLTDLQHQLERVGGSADTQSEVARKLREASRTRNPGAYEKGFDHLVSLYERQEILQRRRALLAKLEETAPAWASAIQQRVGIHGKPEVPDSLEDAWQWRQLHDELIRRTKTSLEELQEQLIHLSDALHHLTAELVEKRAWMAQHQRTTLEQRRALQGWKKYMSRFGSGMGKRAPRMLAEARKLMTLCQTAVPVWIMPLSYVVQNFDPRHNRFDVVIIDEASQADIKALTAIYMGKQVVVVGDHEQVTPAAVGQNIENIQKLIDAHLQDIPLAQLYDGKLSIYSLAQTILPPISLREHFRCVSAIIQFSNDLSYAGKIMPLRDDSDVIIRPPTITHYVQSNDVKDHVNKEEALAVASLLIAASQQQEYSGATFGVISMVGDQQALYIDSLLRRYLSATEYTRRRIMCGNSAQFQGDERDVMFLSMVDTPKDVGLLSIRGEAANDSMYKQRFNVAASRARDQMWVVHSVDPLIDLKEGDIRKRLILHAANPHPLLLDEQGARSESELEKIVLQKLKQAGYSVTSQWPIGSYAIDIVVEGGGRRVALKCDGDRWYSLEKIEEDMAHQAILERLGWRFVRIGGSQFFLNQQQTMETLFSRLNTLGVVPEAARAAKHIISTNKDDIKQRVINGAEILRQQWSVKAILPLAPIHP